jgi:hypothetical protein
MDNSFLPANMSRFPGRGGKPVAPSNVSTEITALTGKSSLQPGERLITNLAAQKTIWTPMMEHLDLSMRGGAIWSDPLTGVVSGSLTISIAANASIPIDPDTGTLVLATGLPAPVSPVANALSAQGVGVLIASAATSIKVGIKPLICTPLLIDAAGRMVANFGTAGDLTNLTDLSAFFVAKFDYLINLESA